MDVFKVNLEGSNKVNVTELVQFLESFTQNVYLPVSSELKTLEVPKVILSFENVYGPLPPLANNVTFPLAIRLQVIESISALSPN